MVLKLQGHVDRIKNVKKVESESSFRSFTDFDGTLSSPRLTRLPPNTPSLSTVLPKIWSSLSCFLRELEVRRIRLPFRRWAIHQFP